MTGRMIPGTDAIMCGWCRQAVAVEGGRIVPHDTYITQEHDGAKIAIPIKCSNSDVLTPFDLQVRYETRADETVRLLREIRDALKPKEAPRT